MLRPLFGYLFFLLASFWLCEDKNIRFNRNWKIVIYGILFQIFVVFAFTCLPSCVSAVEYIARGVMKLKDATLEATRFVFGYVGGGVPPFDVKENTSTFVFAFQVLPTVILVSALSAILTHLRILPVVAKIVGAVFKWVFKVSSSMGMVAAAKIFVGQLEAPLLIKNQLPTLPRSDIFIILSLAFATTSASVMPIYATVLESVCPNAMSHILVSTVLSVISVLIVSAIVMPRGDDIVDHVDFDKFQKDESHQSFMGALSKGLSDGLSIWWCIVGSLIGMIALISLVNYILGLLPNYGDSPLTLQRIFGVFMYPFAWLMGIQIEDLSTVAQILGTKMAVNETIAFFDLANAKLASDSVIKTIYAINNFGNFACIGITVGGLSALVPGKESITELVGKAFVGGLFATGLTATLMSVFFSF